MSKVEIKLNSAGIASLLRSSEIASSVEAAASKVCRRAGEGYSMDVQIHNRAVGRVYAESVAARRENYKSNTLLKALHG